MYLLLFIFFSCAFWTFWSCVMTVAQKAPQKMQIPENKEWYVYTSLSAGGMKLSARLWLCEIEGDSEPTRLWICHPHSPRRSLRESELTLKFFWCALHTRRNGHLPCLIESPNTTCARRYGDHSSTFPAVERKGSKDALSVCVCVYMQFSSSWTNPLIKWQQISWGKKKPAVHWWDISGCIFSPLACTSRWLFICRRKEEWPRESNILGGRIFHLYRSVPPFPLTCTMHDRRLLRVRLCRGGLVMTLAPRKQGYFIWS